jgi:hypothetical protein
MPAHAESRCMGNKAQAKLCKTCARYPRKIEDEDWPYWLNHRARQSNPDQRCKAYREISAAYIADKRREQEWLRAQRKEK